MKSDIVPNSEIDAKKLGLQNLKAEVLANIFFGPPLILLVLAYMGEPLMIVLEVLVFYTLLACFVYGPINYFIPHLLSQNLNNQLKEIQEKGNTDETKKLIDKLLDLPAKNAAVTFFVVMVGFMAGLIFIQGWLVPEWHEILVEMVFVTVAIGFSVGGIQSFLVYTFSENYLRDVIGVIVQHDKEVLKKPFNSRRFPIINKIFTLTFMSMVAAQFSLFGLFIGRLARTSDESIWIHVGFLLAGIALSFIYVLFGVKYFSDNILHALHRLKEWSHVVTRGKNEINEIDVVTNDEFSDVINDIRFMVQKLEEEQGTLRNEKNKLSVILSGIVEGVIAVNAEGAIVTMNDAAEKITGWGEAESQGKRIQDVLVIYDDNDKQVFTDQNIPVQSVLINATPTQTWSDLRMINRQGEDKYITVTATHLPLEKSLKPGGIFTFHDITKEKELEEMKLDFVSIAAHELRTPLTSVVGYTSVFIEENKERFDEDQIKLLGRVQASAQQLSGLVENLLSVSKIERGALTLSKELEDWKKIVALTVTDLSFLAQDKRLHLLFREPEQEIPKVYIDEIRIREVLSNLISNAIHYTPPNGKIEVSIEVSEIEVITHVKDTGVGIPSDALSKLFTKFFRVQGKLGHESKGTGLGLYISKAIIEMHEGRIWVDSEIDVGSTFSFALPIKKLS